MTKIQFIKMAQSWLHDHFYEHPHSVGLMCSDAFKHTDDMLGKFEKAMRSAEPDSPVIPKSLRVGGQELEVRLVERCKNNELGTCCVAQGFIEIAEMYNREAIVVPSVQFNTFLHELTHAILDTMGENELSANEKFVNTFSSFLAEAITSSKL